MIDFIIKPGDCRVNTNQLYLTRGIINTLSLNVIYEDEETGNSPDFSAVVSWELAFTKDLRSPPSFLASTSNITNNENLIDISIDINTNETKEYLNRRTNAVAYGTLKGFDINSEVCQIFVFDVIFLNVGYTTEEVTSTIPEGLTYTKAEVNAMLADIGAAVPHASELQYGTVQLASISDLAAGTDSEKAVVSSALKVELDRRIGDIVIPDITGKEDVSNKATDFSTINDIKFPSIKAVSDYVAQQMEKHGLEAVASVEDLPVDAEEGKIGLVSSGGVFMLYEKGEEEWAVLEYSGLSDVSDALKLIRGEEVEGSPIWENGKDAYQVWLDQGNTGDHDDFFNDIGGLTPEEKAKVATIQNETLTELTGTDVSVAPWTQSKWSASGACTLTATGWAAGGTQTSEILITLAAGSTPSVIGAAVSDNDVLSAAGVYSCFIRNEDGVVRFKIAGFTEET